MFGADVDYMQLAKVYDPVAAEAGREVCVGSTMRRIAGSPDPMTASTSLVERMNLTLRMEMRRYARRTNAHSKAIRNHILALSLFYLSYNFCRTHETLRTTPAVAAGLVEKPCDLRWIIESADALVPHRKRPASN
ncbi:MAG: hypothetical protein F4027_09430 [Rhodospirillaceae bacterium]|nr:hypothetical protein [Rhodospirillaceae bacterium]